ncbi:acyltransferase [Pseudokineococcus basanitobsidens]|uniref:Acyltransferase n=1 Tax=Pseudokineococcus basanitobsidens TaxID=1926649 RepID=A0ABU8RMF8_9ACTN
MTGADLRSTKDSGIQVLRGVAVLLMVAGHVIGSGPGRGLGVPDDSAWRWGYTALEDVRMPLFTVVSGFVYGYRPLPKGTSLAPLVRGKVRRLLVPLAVVGTAYFLVQSTVPGTNRSRSWGELWSIYVLPYEHFWFLQAIFLIFLIVGALDALGVLASPRRLLLVVLLTSAGDVLLRVPSAFDVLSINGALRLLPFFLLGYGVHRHEVRLTRRSGLLLALWLGASYAVWAALLAGEEGPEGAARRALSLSIGIPAVILLLDLRSRLRSRALAAVGGFSFGIYLLHVFGTAGARMLAELLGLTSTGLLFLLSLAAGIAAPIAFERATGHVPMVSWAVLGQRPLRRRARDRVPYETLGPTGDSVR